MIISVEDCLNSFSSYFYNLGSDLKQSFVSFFNHIKWSFHNYRYSKFSFSKNVKIKRSDIGEDLWKAIVKCENIYLEMNGMTTILDKEKAHRSLYDTFMSCIGLKLSPSESFIRKINDSLDEGCCFGTNMALLKQRKIIGKSSIKEKDVAIFQMLQDLQAQMSGMLYELSISNRYNTQKYKECLALHKKINDLIFLKMAGFSQYEEENNLNISTLKDRLQNIDGKVLINIFPKDGNGHSMMIDLDAYHFFDTNASFYEYTSKKILLNNICERFETVYKDTYKDASWSILKLS